MDLRRVPNEVRRDCELTIYAGAILDLHYIAQEDTWTSHKVIMGDTVVPALDGLVPSNSALDVPLDVTVQLKFNEEVTWGPTVQLGDMSGRYTKPRSYVYICMYLYNMVWYTIYII